MKDILAGAIVAFSMYSKLPAPAIRWTDKNMKYAICYFPLIGLVEGVLVSLWFHLALYLNVGMNLRAAVLTVLPILITGGIHMDGFLDTSDALSSWKEMDQKLEILKDSHCGAFAIICGVCYWLLAFGANSQIETADILVISIGFIMSRALSGLALVTFKKAKNTGLLRTFSDAAANRKVAVVMVLYYAASVIAVCLIDIYRGMIMSALSLLVFWYYHHMSYKKFGGITGDLAGWFLQICELAMVLGVVLI